MSLSELWLNDVFRIAQSGVHLKRVNGHGKNTGNDGAREKLSVTRWREKTSISVLICCRSVECSFTARQEVGKQMDVTRAVNLSQVCTNW